MRFRNGLSKYRLVLLGSIKAVSLWSHNAVELHADEKVRRIGVYHVVGAYV